MNSSADKISIKVSVTGLRSRRATIMNTHTRDAINDRRTKNTERHRKVETNDNWDDVFGVDIGATNTSVAVV